MYNTPKLSSHYFRYRSSHITKASLSDTAQYSFDIASHRHTIFSDSDQRGLRAFFFKLRFVLVGSGCYSGTIIFLFPSYQTPRTSLFTSLEQIVQMFSSIVLEYSRLQNTSRLYELLINIFFLPQPMKRELWELLWSEVAQITFDINKALRSFCANVQEYDTSVPEILRAVQFHEFPIMVIFPKDGSTGKHHQASELYGTWRKAWVKHEWEV